MSNQTNVSRRATHPQEEVLLGNADLRFKGKVKVRGN